MSTLDPHARRESIATSIARRAGPGADASATARATLAVWDGMATQLEPVIGARGVDALFGRALHLAGKQFPWLAAEAVRGGSASALDHVQQRLADQGHAQASAAAQALLGGFTELLVTLVGDSLATQLLGPAWEAAPSLHQGEITL
jgi:hypothetical protein